PVSGSVSAGTGGDRRGTSGYSPVVPVGLPCGGRRRRLSLGTGHLGILTGCSGKSRNHFGQNGGSVIRCTFMLMGFGALALGGIALAQHSQHGKGEDYVKLLSQKDIIEKLDGKKAKATMVEVTLAPGQVEAAHRHPGPAFGYILEGEYEWAIDNNKPK